MTSGDYARQWGLSVLRSEDLLHQEVVTYYAQQWGLIMPSKVGTDFLLNSGDLLYAQLWGLIMPRSGDYAQ